MILVLRQRWHEEMPFAEMVTLRDQLDAMHTSIRRERGIRWPVFKCTVCGHVGEGGEQHVSVRALILALRRIGIGTDGIRSIERQWSAFRELNGLDIHGKPTVPRPISACGH